VVLAAVQSPLLAEAKLASVLIPRMCSSILLAPSSCRHVRPRPARSSATPCMAACVQCCTSPAGHALPAFSVARPGPSKRAGLAPAGAAGGARGVATAEKAVAHAVTRRPNRTLR
jgi:hypothetical protein